MVNVEGNPGRGDVERELDRSEPSRGDHPYRGSFAAAPSDNPYRGLLAFDASHRGVFFGRRLEVNAVVARLRVESIVLVTGEPGVGKSSLCRAGVIPAVVDGELGGAWQALAIAPGHRPLTALASAIGYPALLPRLRETPELLARELRRYAGDRGLILFVDQLEELITLSDPSEVAALDAGLAALADGSPRLRLLATVRADFLARIATLPGLGRDLSRLLYFLRPLRADRMRDVIVGPATALGARFESDDIVEELISAGASAGSSGLPLLSFALAELWEARDRVHAVIPRDAVRAMGNVSRALSRHADAVVCDMSAADKLHVRRILLRLVTAMGTRALRPASELVLGDSAGKALDTLVQAGLVAVRDGPPEPGYELAHECLVTSWGTLRQWLDSDGAERAVRERLAAAAAEWIRLGRRSDATWQGVRLDEARALDPDSISADDRAFVASSQRAVRRRRFQRWLVALGAVVLVVAAYSTQRYLAHRELAAEISDELQLARDARDSAHDAARARSDLAVQASAAFDAMRRGDGERLWQQGVTQRDNANRAYRSATTHTEVALAKDRTRGDVRDLAADILLDRAALADQVHDVKQLDELLEHVALYDSDGSRRARWDLPGHVIVRAPQGAAISLEPPRSLGSNPFDLKLPRGSYIVSIAVPGRALVRAPILVERGGELTIQIAPPRSEDVPPGFVYVPAGESLYGNANDEDRATFFATTPLRRRSAEAFLIGRTEVTFGDWLAFVDAQPPSERARWLPSVPSRLSGGVALKPDGAGHWRIELQITARRYTAGWGEPIIYAGRTRQAVQDWRRFPVLGVSADDATAYAVWLDRTGRVPGARLCSEVEWERAGRGADGRAYPAGHPLGLDDANVDDTYGQALKGPDEVGSHPASRSPFGLDDMSGNALEWTVSEAAEDGGFILRSGSYWHDRKSAHLTNRTYMDAMMRDATIGFRLCATPPLPR